MTITSPGRSDDAAEATRACNRPATSQLALLRRAWQAPLGAHAVVLALVLLVAMVVADPHRLLNADEGAAAAQANELAEGRGWTISHPLPEVDPDGVAFPLDLSAQREGTHEFAPFAKHPVYPAALAVAMRVGGMPAAAALSVLGTVGAALGAALISKRFAVGLERATFWATGLLSPLLYFSFVMIAHTVGAAVVAFLVLAVLRFLERSTAPRLVTIAGLAAVAVLLRNEAVLFGAALGAVLVVGAVLRRHRAAVVAGAAVLAGTAVAYLFDAWLEARVLGGAAVEPFSISTDSVVADRVNAFRVTVVMLLDGEPLAKLGNLLAVMLLVAAVMVARRRPGEAGMVRVLSVGAAAGAVAWMLTDPTGVVHGLLLAFPILAIGLAALGRDDWRRAPVPLLALSCALFFPAVLATQYRSGGAGWGGRYFVVAIPVIAPVAVLGLRRLRSTLPAGTTRLFFASAGVVAVAFVATPLLSVTYAHVRDAALQDMVASATSEVSAGDGDARPVVVSTSSAAGRFSWRLVAQQRWLSVDAAELPAYAERLRTAGIERFVLLGEDLDTSVADLAAEYEPVGSVRLGTSDFPTVGVRVLALSAQVMQARQ